MNYGSQAVSSKIGFNLHVIHQRKVCGNVFSSIFDLVYLKILQGLRGSCTELFMSLLVFLSFAK